MRQGNQAVGSTHWQSHWILQDQKAGFSIDDLDRLGMVVPERTRMSALWRHVPVGDLPQAMADEAAGGMSAGWPDPAMDARPLPDGPCPDDRRMLAEIREWSAQSAPRHLPLRGSFADFREALRLRLTGLPSRTSAAGDLDAETLAGIAGAAAAQAFLRGDIGLRDLQYRVRHRDGLGAYRWGEAQLEDLGYYRRLPHPAAANAPARLTASREMAWHGHFTGRRGILTVGDLLQADVQECLLLEAFAHHLREMERRLPAGLALGDVIGGPVAAKTAAADEPGARLTVSALLAAAQIHGAPAAIDAALHPDSLTRGKAMEQCLRSFAGFATPFDGMPRPSGAEIDHVMARIREVAEGRKAVDRLPPGHSLQRLGNSI